MPQPPSMLPPPKSGKALRPFLGFAHGTAPPAFRPAGAGGKTRPRGIPASLEGSPDVRCLRGLRCASQASRRDAPHGPDARPHGKVPFQPPRPIGFLPAGKAFFPPPPHPPSGPGLYTLYYNSLYIAALPLAALRRADSAAVDPAHTGLSQGGKGQGPPPRGPSLAAAPSGRGSLAKSRLFPKDKAADGETGTPPGCHFPCRRRSEKKGVVAAHAFRRERRINHEPFHNSELVTPPRGYNRDQDES